jgi:hypothetical protein
VRGDHVLLAPPFILDAAAVDTIVERLGEAIDAAVSASSPATARPVVFILIVMCIVLRLLSVESAVKVQ